MSLSLKLMAVLVCNTSLRVLSPQLAITVPPLAEQERIVKLLDEAD